MTNDRVIKALKAAAQALDPSTKVKAGDSFETSEVALSLVETGRKPFNRDIIEQIQALSVHPHGGGDESENTGLVFRDQNGSGPISRLDEKKKKRETVVLLGCPKGAEKDAFQAVKKALAGDFTVTMLPKYRKAQVVAGAVVKASSGGQVFIGLVLAPALGEWLEPSSDEDDLQKQIDTIVAKAKKRMPEAEEWMVSDYDEFPNLGEYPGVAALAKVAGLLEDHDEEIVQAAFEESHDVDDAAKMLEDGYAVYDSETQYGEQLVDDLGKDGIKNAEWYVDMDALARDVMMDVDIVYVNGAPFAFHN